MHREAYTLKDSGLVNVYTLGCISNYHICTNFRGMYVIIQVFAVNWPSVEFSSSKFHWQNFGCHVCLMSMKFLRLGDPRKYNHENAGFVASSNLHMYFENLYVYSTREFTMTYA